MTNANSVAWGALRGRDLVAGFGFFIFAVAVNLLLWIWNDSAIKDSAASSQDISGADLETKIGQEFVKAPWAIYRGLILVIAIVITGSLVYGVFW